MENTKPRHVVVPLRPFLEKLIDRKIEKDLDDGEELCPTCGGFSLTIRDNPYFKREGQYQMSQFKNEQLVLMNCPDCYNGVVKRCRLCGEIIRRGWLKHDCEKQQALDREEKARKEAERLAQAPVAPPEVVKDCHVFFSDYYSGGFFEDFLDFFEEWHELENDKGYERRPEYVWTTTPEEFSIDARDICENATEDLYEDAYDDISDKDLERLQSLLDDWCNSTGVGTTYNISHKYKVRIPWAEYDKMYGKEALQDAHQKADH